MKKLKSWHCKTLVVLLLLLSALLLANPFTAQAEPAREKNPELPAKSTQTRPAVPPIPELPRIHFPADPVQVSIPPAKPEIPSSPRYAVIPASLRPGDPVTIAYADSFTGPGSKDFQAVLLDTKGKRILKAPFFSFAQDSQGQEIKTAILGVPSTVEPGPLTIRIEAANRIIQDLPLMVEKRDFVAETIDLDQGNTDIRTAPDPQKVTESEQLSAILYRTGTDIYTNGPFLPPVASTRRTSFFGDRRVFRYVTGNTDTSIHAGVDYGVPKGTEVRACAMGKVVLARPRIVTGNSVVLEHMPGVYSLYYHLDSIAVVEGQMAGAGLLLGLSGATGLATGPHLHWEVRAAGENTDPDALVSRAILDKDEILSKLIAY
ncbi:M23 family metallopeptidase [Leadbettera azotonutricia]|uniref:M23/M37 peptidase domain protein n=1 Tax=Leadbettera azotonutricia (strain ATCC BAA-888 / DSM 13862 / ZAS-9) TaxID=545695 RepID=F5Y6Q7_LEAAZ|nr:M23 family metallopeptidase [Leadbettera azotonutricia]AEF81681.1 M23/M37 peptidase domain protein [Leadbettera azotonutricia ZAS-9]